MAKILVADDNSNVQRTVTQALASLGVEVVAVNNGEAAVRKLSEVSPDLVLADIFMPVRNGYEVCEFVKKDARFSHVPVVLLAGAFDPFDEREAQRVGADGILKKPFVPPDPLVTMVKTLLDRVMGERLMAVSVGKASGTRESQSAAAVQVLVHRDHPEAFPEPAAQPGTSTPGRVAFGEGERPVAFGALLEAPEAEISEPRTGTLDIADDEQILTSQRDTTLGEPIFWRSDKENENQDGADAAISEPQASTDHLPELSAKLQEHTLETADNAPRWGEEIPALALHPSEPLVLVHEEQEQASQSTADPSAVVLDPAEYAPLTVDSTKPEELAANPLDWLASAPSVPPNSALEETAAEMSSDEKTADNPDSNDIEGPSLRPAFTLELATQDEDQPVTHVIPTPVVQQAVDTPEDTVRSIPKPHWYKDALEENLPTEDWAELSAAVQLSAKTSLEQTGQPASESLSDPVPVLAAVSSPGPVSVPVSAPISGPSSTDVSRDAAADSPAPAPDPALVEAVVQRVLEKMRPQVVEIITKEFLRPVVQALVYREIEKK